MCLTVLDQSLQVINNIVMLKPIITEEDIIVYKILETKYDRLLTPFKRFPVPDNNIIKVDTFTTHNFSVCTPQGIVKHLQVMRGVHSLTSIYGVITLLDEHIDMFYTMDEPNTLGLFKAVIPKGTEIIFGTDHEIVSLELHIQHKMSEKEIEEQLHKENLPNITTNFLYILY